MTRPIALLLLLAFAQSAHAYAVLTHQQLIDQAWASAIAPILLRRFPTLTPQQLRRAHAYAYGGCVIQDLGYYPFGNEFFSELTHYVRSGDFVQSLFHNAKNADELAFAIGALSHYIGDSIGHSEATNPSVAICFPKLRAKYGSSVNYAENKTAHGRVEFAFDINQIVKERLAPSGYLRHVGFRVPRQQLSAAFYETYGLRIGEILGLFRTAIRSYRFGARSFLPGIAYAEALLHRDRFPPDTPGPQLDLYERHIAQLAREVGWDTYRRGSGAGIYLLAGIVFIIPKIGPAAQLAIKSPTIDTEKRYIESVNHSTAMLSVDLAQLSARQSQRLPEGLPNLDLDTGVEVVPGGYRLTDKTYAKLLDRVTKDMARGIPAGLKQDILRYYTDPNTPISTKRNRKKWDRVQEQLQLLTRVPTRSPP